MKQEDYKYLLMLLKESVTEAFGKAKNNSFDDDEYAPDDYDDFSYGDENDVDNNNVDDEQNKTNKNNSKNPYAKGKELAHVIKNNSYNALDRQRKGLPSDPEVISGIFMRDYKNPYNKSKRDVLLPDKYGRIKIEAASISKSEKYGVPIILLTFLNIDREDCVSLMTKFNDIGNTLKVNIARTRENNDKDGVTFIINDSNYSLWKENDLKQIIDFLKNIKYSNGEPKYFKNDEEVKNLMEYIDNRVITGKDLGAYFIKAKQNNIDLFNAFIEAENDSQMKEFIDFFQRFGITQKLCSELNVDKYFGHILSVQNAALVLGSKQLTGAGVKPTFILTERMWIEKFKRFVKPNAKPFYIFVPSNKHRINNKKEAKFTSKPYTTKDKNGNEYEISSSPDVLNVFFSGKKWDELTEQQKIEANIMCNYINPSECYPQAEYDVSDTELIDPNVDPFTTQIGIINRFTGELNSAAINFINQQNINGANSYRSDDGNNDDNNENAFNIRHEEWNKLVYENILGYCKEHGIKIKTTKDISLNIINALRLIAEKYITYQKPENRVILIDDAVWATCKVMKIALDKIKKEDFSIGKPSNQVEFSQYFKAFSQCMDAVNGTYATSDKQQRYYSNVSESINDGGLSFRKYTEKELLYLSKKIFSSNDFEKTEFYTLLERMNKIIK